MRTRLSFLCALQVYRAEPSPGDNSGSKRHDDMLQGAGEDKRNIGTSPVIKRRRCETGGPQMAHHFASGKFVLGWVAPKSNDRPNVCGQTPKNIRRVCRKLSYGPTRSCRLWGATPSHRDPPWDLGAGAAETRGQAAGLFLLQPRAYSSAA